MQFDGRNSWWAPEELLLGAVALCLMTTFQALARRREVPVSDYRCQVSAILDKTREGLVFTAIDLKVRLAVSTGDQGQAETLLATAKRHCIIANALRAPVRLMTEITAEPTAARG